MEVCPENAITEGKRVLGATEAGNCGELAFGHGCLRVGEAMVPPLIKKVRSQENRNPTTIIDAPPGTSCPVIAAMKGADFILLVTEPTPFGLHDLKLAVEAVKLMDIPCGLVINRADMGDDQVKEYAEKEQLPVLMEIPFDRKIAEAYSRGEQIIKVMPEWAGKFRNLYNDIEQLLNCPGEQQC